MTTRSGYAELEETLRQKGFAHDTRERAPICRWRVDGITVDAMPTSEDILGFSNRWYGLVMETSRRFTFPEGPTVRIIAGPAFLASKLEAFEDRGREDVYGSHDLEDILTLVDQRSELAAEIRESSDELRAYVGERIRALLDHSQFLNALPGLMEPGPAMAGRVQIVLDRLRLLAALA